MLAIVDLESGILIDPRLGKNDLKVAFALSSFADSKTGECFPSRAALAETTNISVNDVSAATRRLVSCGYLVKTLYKGMSTQYKVLITGIKKDSKKADPLVKKGGVRKTDPSVKKGPPQNDPYLFSGGVDADPSGISGGDPSGISGGVIYNTNRTTQLTNKKLKQKDWASMSFPKFRDQKDRPDYSERFDSLWRRYRKACEEIGPSVIGDKLTAWFRYLQAQQRFTVQEISLATRPYVAAKRQAQQTLAHLSTFLNNLDGLEQYLEEATEKADNANHEKAVPVSTPEPDLSARFGTPASAGDREADNSGGENRAGIGAVPSTADG